MLLSPKAVMVHSPTLPNLRPQITSLVQFLTLPEFIKLVIGVDGQLMEHLHGQATSGAQHSIANIKVPAVGTKNLRHLLIFMAASVLLDVLSAPPPTEDAMFWCLARTEKSHGFRTIFNRCVPLDTIGLKA